MRKYYVYILEDENRIPFYVGKGSKTQSYSRLDYHIKYWRHNKNRKLTNKISKLNGTFNISIVFESDIELDCFEKEKELIERIGIRNLCNLTEGGEGASGWKHTLDIREKMSLSAKAHVETSIHNLKKACRANEGQRKAADYNIEVLYGTLTIYEIVKITGLDFSTVKRYLVEKNLYVPNKNRKPDTQTTRAAKSKGQKSRIRREVLQYSQTGELVQSWRCAMEAMREFGKSVGSALRGKQKTAYGYVWKYLEI